MTDMRRTFLWVVFTMSLVLLWDGWNKHNGKPSMFSPTPANVVAAGSAPGGALPAASGAGASAVAASGAASVPLASQTVHIKTDLLSATLDTKGGSLTRVELLAHNDEAEKSGHVVVLDGSSAHQYVAETGLVGITGAPNHFTLMSLVSADTELKSGVNELNVRFESPESGGLKLVKTYTFKRGEYQIGVKHEVVNTSAAAVSPQLYVQLVRNGDAAPGASSFYSTFTGPAVFFDKFTKVEFSEIEKRKASDVPDYPKTAASGWVAMVQHYFVSAWLRNATGEREFYTKKVADNLYSVGMVFGLGTIAPGATGTAQDVLYIGPQEEKKLQAIAPGLERVKDYGMFHIVAQPLFTLMSYLHSLLGNWGWSIVALVVLLKIAFYWLNASAYRSMAKMKAVNPRIQEMRERLKDKPQQMQQEMMRIYKEEKINPLGGCLPIFVQMPVFIALYWVLLSSVEMRHAPWALWIHDLSAKDPLFILPLVMMATSLVQVWLQPAPADPMQAKMMWFMPIAFGVMFFFFPAGLTLYYCVNNILTIAQQWFINKRMGVN